MNPWETLAKEMGATLSVRQDEYTASYTLIYSWSGVYALRFQVAYREFHSIDNLSLAKKCKIPKARLILKGCIS